MTEPRTELKAGAELVDMEEMAYHATPALGSTDIKNLLRSPAHFKAARAAAPETEAMRVGSLIHECILEPDLWAKRVLAPKFDRRTKKGKAESAEWQEKLKAEGLTEVSPDDFALCAATRESVMGHRLARAIIERVERREVSCFWPDVDVNCKARFDGLGPGLVLDLKSTVDASPGAFRNSVARYGYHTQAAHYSVGAHAATDQWPDYAILAIEKKPPFACAVYMLDNEAMSVGTERRNQALDLYRECLESGKWPAYPETVQTLSLPNWAKQEW